MRVLVLGLDGVPPELVFDRFIGELPHLRGLMGDGAWGRLASVTPPVTVPAWASAMTGCDPGELGIYGFTRRIAGAYGGELVDATDVRRETLWERVSRAGLPVIVLGVPPSYPPRRVNGCLVGCFLTPDTRRQYTYPAALGGEIAAVVGDYALDVAGFRERPKREVAREILAMTRQRFQLFGHLLRSHDWALAVMVDMGPDRLHHAFLRHLDDRHPAHDPASPHRDVIRQYYRALDAEIGTLLAALPPDTAVVVLSDHGARPMCGGICLNEWLRREGYLVLKQEPTSPVAFAPELVDFSRTQAWALGGYAGRIYLNLAGREPGGIVAPADAAPLLDELEERLLGLGEVLGERHAPRAIRPRDRYAECHGLPPDLLVEFGELDYRALGVLGSGVLVRAENDSGPDDANHDRFGIFATNVSASGRGEQLDLRLQHCLDDVPRWLGIARA